MPGERFFLSEKREREVCVGRCSRALPVQCHADVTEIGEGGGPFFGAYSPSSVRVDGAPNLRRIPSQQAIIWKNGQGNGSEDQ